MVSHYNQISDTKDKIIHLLYAGYMANYYGQCIIECITEFGEEKTKEAIAEFKANYKEGVGVL